MEFKTDKLLHGGDYNPEQWLSRPDILEKDIQMLERSGCNVVSLGIFSWSRLEPEEGRYDLEWMKEIVDRLWERGIRTILATPTGARPKWMADRYPEVLRVRADRRKELFGGRHNHCYTSPVYREKMAAMNRELSRTLGSHPGVILWHISNELGGECHCPLCQQAFRDWLKERYGTIEKLNEKWYTAFWSHTYDSFDQIESPSPIGEWGLHGLSLDWKRFVSHQTADFVKAEIRAIREGGSLLPTTVNMMYYYDGLDYGELAETVDVASWDSYPTWHKGPVLETAYDNGMCHDWIRSLKKKPFLQMESCPSSTNWQGVSKLKKPGMLFAQGMQAIAHGADGSMYFQVRQSRGSSEKFHGAIIDHYGGEDTRVFREVAQVGETLAALECLTGTEVKSRAAILYDQESIWAMEEAQGPRNQGLHYKEALLKNYRALRKLGLDVDLIDMEASLEDYQLLAVSMGYLFKEGFTEKVRDFVEEGGTLVMSYWSGIVDENDLCYLGGTPHGLMDVLGLRCTEIDGLYDWENNEMNPVEGNELGLTRAYTCKNLCALVTADYPGKSPETAGARTVMTYGEDFYAGTPVLTVNRFGKGQAWYVAADGEAAFYEDFYRAVARELGERLALPLMEELPEGIELTTRQDEENRYLIYQNFGEKPELLPLPKGQWERVFGEPQEALKPYGLVVIRTKRKE